MIKKIIITIVVIGVVVAYFLFDHSRVINYQEFITELIGENAEITEIEITEKLGIQKREFRSTINDPALIKKLIYEPSFQLKKDLRKSSPQLSEFDNILTIKTKTRDDLEESFYFNIHYLHDGVRGYRIKFDEDNQSLLFLIEEKALEWTEIEK